MKDRTVTIASIKIGSRFRKELGDVVGLAKSIATVGLLHPPVVTTDNDLVCGFRRIRAAESLGWDAIPVRVIDPEELIQAEHDENECRKDFTTSERVAIADAIKSRIHVKQGQRPTSGQMPRSERPRDEAAKAAGFDSTDEYRRAKKVTEKAEPELIEAMDAGKLPVSTAAKAAELPAKTQRKIAASEEPAKAAREAVKQAEEKKEEAKDPIETFVGELNRLARLADAYKAEVKKVVESHPLGIKFVHLESITIQIESARKAIWQARPTEVCNCTKRGKTEPTCKACHGTGKCPAARVLR